MQQKQKLKSKAEQLLAKYIDKQSLANKAIAIACSAGIDSISLLQAAAKLHKQVHCIHYDHAIREDSALADQTLAKLCLELKINYYSERNPHPLAKDEDSLRALRYSFYVRAATKLNLSDVLVAHNLNDNAETVLFRLFRGTGVAGITGIPERRELSYGVVVHRPWLKLSRSEIEAYAQELGTEHVEDTSNENPKYARNHIRLNILPETLKVNLKALVNIDNFAGLIAEQNDFINNELSKYEFKFNNQDPELNWALEEFRQVPKVIQRKLIEKYISTNISFSSDFLAAIAKGGFHRINFTDGKYFCIRQKRIRLEEDA